MFDPDGGPFRPPPESNRLSTFHQLHPEIEIQVATSTRPLTEINDHFNVALQRTGCPSGLNVLEFTAADEVFPACSPNYHRTTPPHLMEWDSWLQTFGQTLDGYPQGSVFDSYPLMLQATVEGHCIAMGWRRTTGRLIESGAMVRLCAESVPLAAVISVFRRQGGEDRLEVRALIGWLEEELRIEG